MNKPDFEKVGVAFLAPILATGARMVGGAALRKFAPKVAKKAVQAARVGIKRQRPTSVRTPATQFAKSRVGRVSTGLAKDSVTMAAFNKMQRPKIKAGPSIPGPTSSM